MTTRSAFVLSRSSSRAFTSDPFSVQQKHPALTSIRLTLPPSRICPSIPTWPNSLTMTASRSLVFRSVRILRARVVFPEPRKPQSTFTSIELLLPRQQHVRCFVARKANGLDKDVLEVGPRCQRDVLDSPSQRSGSASLGLGQEGHLGTKPSGIPHVTDPLDRQIRQEMDPNSTFDI